MYERGENNGPQCLQQIWHLNWKILEYIENRVNKSVAYRKFLKVWAIRPQPNMLSGKIYSSGKKGLYFESVPELINFVAKKKYSLKKRSLIRISPKFYGFCPEKKYFRKKSLHFESLTAFIIFGSEDFWFLWKQKKESAHRTVFFFLPKRSPRVGHGSKITVQHIVNLYISDLHGGPWHNAPSPSICYCLKCKNFHFFT